MRVLKKSRKRPRRGEVFLFQLDDGRVLYGRVVRDDIEYLGVSVYLVYIYSKFLDDTDDVPEDFDVAGLLLPPMLVRYRMWTKGYFKVAGHFEIQQGEELQQHCFDEEKENDPESYVDEYGNYLPKKSEPCGPAGLFTESGVEGEVLRALS